MVVDERKQLLIEWLEGIFETSDFSCEAASSDASFRRYFRITLADKTFVVMDAPPDKEDCTDFISIATFLFTQGINAPQIFHQSLERGFLVLSDLGSESYLDGLTNITATSRYDDAVQALHKMHQLSLSEVSLPPYDSQLLGQEMDLFEEWFVKKLLNVTLLSEDKETLAKMKKMLINSALEQPQVFVHRDYHSRNLMVTEENNPGIIDFQDAVIGPITYDLVSLYRDCYIAWPNDMIYEWLDVFLQQRQDNGCDDVFNSSTFYQWFDWMGVQRHLKVLGIFARLSLSDGKPSYLNDIPQTMAYVLDVCRGYDVLLPLAEMIEKHGMEGLFEKKQKELARI